MPRRKVRNKISKGLARLLAKATMVHMPPNRTLQPVPQAHWIKRGSLIVAGTFLTQWVLPKIGLPLWLGVLGTVVFALAGFLWPKETNKLRQRILVGMMAIYSVIATGVIVRPL